MKKIENRPKAGLSSHLSAAKWLTRSPFGPGSGPDFYDAQPNPLPLPPVDALSVGQT